MRLFMHVCCASCAIYPLERLREKAFQIEGFFYNPNIHPFSEYKNRKQAIENFSKIEDFIVSYPDYNPLEFFHAVNLREASPARCSLCWTLRLKKTAQTAKEKMFDYFSTTLLVSPYQNHELLKEIGSDIAKVEGIDFYYEDFRGGFKKAHAIARAQGIYCQKYCGCIYSEIERYKNKSQFPISKSVCNSTFRI